MDLILGFIDKNGKHRQILLHVDSIADLPDEWFETAERLGIDPDGSFQDIERCAFDAQCDDVENVDDLEDELAEELACEDLETQFERLMSMEEEDEW